MGIAKILGALGAAGLLFIMAIVAYLGFGSDALPRCSESLSTMLGSANDSDNTGRLRIIDFRPKTQDNDQGQVKLGGRICLAVAGIAAKAADAQGKPVSDPARNPTVDVTLFLNELRSPLTIKAQAIPEPQILTYDLIQPSDANTDPAAFWRRLVGGKSTNGNLKLSVGIARSASTVQEATHTGTLDLVLYYWWLLALGGLTIPLLVAAFVIFAANSSILRDSAITSQGSTIPIGTFSLARTQMALWLGLVTAGFIFLWLTLGLYLHVITASILVLLGINGVTGLAAVTMDGENAPKTESKSFLTDIISDPTGPKLHRIQVVIWTCLLAVIFAWNVVWNFVFVEFDTNLLLLMGIANSMYLGIKHSEKS
jgi:hypothetical protein